MLARVTPTSGTVRGMENIVGVYSPETREPRYYFRIENTYGSNWSGKPYDAVSLFLVDDLGNYVVCLLSLVNKGGSWQLLLKIIPEEIRASFDENFDFDGCHLHVARE